MLSFNKSHHQGFKVAYIVFKNASSIQKALKMSFEKERILSTTEKPILTGLKSKCDHGNMTSLVLGNLKCLPDIEKALA